MSDGGTGNGGEGVEPAAPGGDGGGGQGLILAGILVLVALLAFGAWMAGNDDLGGTVARSAERFPDPSVPVDSSTSTGASSTTIPPVASSLPGVATLPVLPETTPVATPPPTPAPTEPPTTPVATAAPTLPPTTVAPVTTIAETTTVAPTTVPEERVLTIDEVVPNIAAFPEHLATPDAVRTAIAALLTTPRHDVASAGPVATLCAAVTLDGPIDVSGRWEHDGRKVASSKLTYQNVPGYGDCFEDDGEPLADGSYQYIATDRDGGESAAANFVVGAAPIDQRFVNDGDVALCAVEIAPTSSRYFEVYDFGSQPIAPGATVTIPIAEVRQDVQTVACTDREIVSTFDFEPSVESIQSLAP